MVQPASTGEPEYSGVFQPPVVVLLLPAATSVPQSNPTGMLQHQSSVMVSIRTHVLYVFMHLNPP